MVATLEPRVLSGNFARQSSLLALRAASTIEVARPGMKCEKITREYSGSYVLSFDNGFQFRLDSGDDGTAIASVSELPSTMSVGDIEVAWKSLGAPYCNIEHASVAGSHMHVRVTPAYRRSARQKIAGAVLRIFMRKR